jgi:hypothetical protein
MIPFVAGVFVGGFLGTFVVALLVASSDRNEGGVSDG